MNKKTRYDSLVIAGFGGHGRVLLDLLSDYIPSLKLIVIDQEADRQRAHLHNLSYYKTEELFFSQSNLVVDKCWFVNGVGVSSDTKKRAKIFNKIRAHGGSFPTIVAKSADVSKAASIFQGAQILRNAVVQPGAVVGENTIVNSGAIIEHDVIVEQNVHVSPGATVCGGAKIESGAIIGPNAVVGRGVIVGRDSIVGAGASVVRDLDRQTKLVPVSSDKSKLKDLM